MQPNNWERKTETTDSPVNFPARVWSHLQTPIRTLQLGSTLRLPPIPLGRLGDAAHLTTLSETVPSAMANLRDCFDQLLALPPQERAAWLLSQVIEVDQHNMLERMVAEAEAAQTQRDGSDLPERLQRLAATQDDAAAAAWIGRRVGAFKLLRLIGQGGMGAIFLAEREDADFAQQVAVKLLRRGMFSDLEHRLFRRERQALASLSHANIARLIDGGVTEAGTPFLAMEYVDGLSITHFCSEHRLPLRRRLELLLAVCRAVQHAHGSLIVHRDIKPSNILVSSDGTPKLLDFGVAKLLDGEDGETQTGMAALTPEYAAPEQFCGGPITAATDVYALGTLMHELLLGERPLHSPARRPSSRVIELNADNTALPSSPSLLRGLLRGDLDNMILKALEIEPQRRYATAGTLGDDIERYLQGLPVTAHPPSRWYRGRKFVQRHRGGVAVSVVLAAALLVSFALSLWQTHVARLQTLRAEHELARATATTTFMLGMFEGIAPSGLSALAPTVADLLASGTASLRDNPMIDADDRDVLLIKLASVQRRWGRPEDAAANAQQVVTARTAARQTPDRIALMAVEQWMLARHAIQEYDEVNRIYAQYGAQAQLVAPDLAAILLSISSNADGGQLRPQALAKARRAIELCRAHCIDADQLRVRRNLVDVLDDIEVDTASASATVDLKEAQSLLLRLIADAPAIDGAAHPNVADDYFELSYVLRKLGQLEEAARTADIGIKRILAVYDRPHPRMIVHFLNAGRIAAARHQPAQAIALLTQALDLHTTQLTTDYNFLPAIVIALAEVEIASGARPTALPHLLRIRQLLATRPGESDTRLGQIDELIRRSESLAPH
ncbi:MAG: serine/threonine-protein kinase [Pseudomonadota bacterium]|nr:serine/threonine-protein kinase [Pseudomonadota bacterium]